MESQRRSRAHSPDEGLDLPNTVPNTVPDACSGLSGSDRRVARRGGFGLIEQEQRASQFESQVPTTSEEGHTRHPANGSATFLWGDGMLYGVEPRDPATFAIATRLLIDSGLVASWAPCRRATRVDRVESMREGT